MTWRNIFQRKSSVDLWDFPTKCSQADPKRFLRIFSVHSSKKVNDFSPAKEYLELLAITYCLTQFQDSHEMQFLYRGFLIWVKNWFISYTFISAAPQPSFTHITVQHPHQHWHMYECNGVLELIQIWVLDPSELFESFPLLNELWVQRLSITFLNTFTANTNMTATPEIYLQSFNDNQEAGGWKTNAHWSCKHHAKITGPEYRTGHYF